MARLAIGFVAGASGDNGAIRVHWFGDGPEGLLAAGTVWLAVDNDDEFPRRHLVKGAAVAGGVVRMELVGLRESADAKAYKSRLVLVEQDELAPLGDDEYYWYELIGFDVETDAGDPIGRVVELLETGAHDVLVVAAPGGEQHLIPTAREFLTEIDREARRLVVALIPGLLD